MSVASYDAAFNINMDTKLRVCCPKRAGVILTEYSKLARSRARRRTGQIYFGNPEEHCGCLILCRSTGGALIEVDSDGPFPREVRLISAALKVNKMGEVVSHQGRKIRLKFAN
jgi:hypothetical protein